jgi:hypothetical protein
MADSFDDVVGTLFQWKSSCNIQIDQIDSLTLDQSTDVVVDIFNATVWIMHAQMRIL